jgi:hypothetical protein
MVNRENRISLYFAMTLLALLLSGCAGTVKNMRPVPPDKVIASPEEGKAMVVFMRPSSLGAAIQSSVFEVRGDNLTLVGIVAAKKKVAYQLEAGNHLFMVVGESADYMSAELEPNKAYYALVAPRMGVWKARFSLKPVSSEQLNSSQFSEWYEDCEWVENTPDSYNWASSNMTSIQAKHKKYYPKWMEKDLADRPKLLLQDGK